MKLKNMMLAFMAAIAMVGVTMTMTSCSDDEGGNDVDNKTVEINGTPVKIEAAFISLVHLEDHNAYLLNLFLADGKTIRLGLDGTMHDGENMDLTKTDKNEDIYWFVNIRHSDGETFNFVGGPSLFYPLEAGSTMRVKCKNKSKYEFDVSFTLNFHDSDGKAQTYKGKYNGKFTAMNNAK